MTRNRKLLVWFVVAGVIAAAGGFLFILLTGVLGVLYLPAGSGAFGNFKVAYSRAEGFGHTSVKMTLYYRRKLISRDLAGWSISPVDSERLVFRRWCTEGVAADQCGTLYFDGHKGRSYQISRSDLSLAALDPKYAEEEHHPWSPDGRFVVIHDERKLYLLNLDTGSSVDIARRLGAQTSTHFVQYLGSSPDARQAALLVCTNVDRRPPDRHFDSDLYTIDPVTMALNYVSSVGPYELGQIEYGWQPQGSGYEMRFELKYSGGGPPLSQRGALIPP